MLIGLARNGAGSWDIALNSRSAKTCLTKDSNLALHGTAVQQCLQTRLESFTLKIFAILDIAGVYVTTSKEVTGIDPTTRLKALLNAASES